MIILRLKYGVCQQQHCQWKHKTPCLDELMNMIFSALLAPTPIECAASHHVGWHGKDQPCQGRGLFVGWCSSSQFIFGHDFDAGGSYFARPEFGQNILFAKVETSVCCDVWHGWWSQNATLGKVVAVFYPSILRLSGVDSSSHDQNSFVWTQGSFFTHWHGNLLWSHLIPC